MPRTARKNLHVPLPEPLYKRLRTEAARTRRPATDLAREAIVRWLHEQQRNLIQEEIQAYARAVGGTKDDLDEQIESAAIENLRDIESVKEPEK